jgi:putative transcriptional regulator
MAESEDTDVLIALAAGLAPVAPPAAAKAELLDLADAPRAPIDPSAFTWEEPFPGIRICLLNEDPSRGMTGRLVWGAPGAIYPAHRHSAAEATLILEGAYRDERGRHGAGDVSRETEHTTHSIEILPEGDCFSYIVAYGETEIL